MKLKDYISEGTYDNLDGLTREIAKYLDTKLKGRDQSQINYIDITKTIPKELNPKNRTIAVKYLNGRLAKKKQLNDVGMSGNEITMRLYWEDDYHNIYSDWRTSNSFYLIKTIKHELVHVLDYASDLATKEFDNSQEPDYITNPATYWSNSFEFNQLINALKEYKRVWKKSWEGITTLDKLFNISDKHGLMFVKSDKHLRNDVNFRKGLLSRLSREGFRPPNLKL